MWICTGNKLAKVHGNTLSLSKNIAKRFRGATFLTHTVHSAWRIEGLVEKVTPERLTNVRIKTRHWLAIKELKHLLIAWHLKQTI